MTLQRVRILFLPLILVALLVGLLPTSSPATALAATFVAQPIGSSVMVTASTLNVRQGPGTTYRIIERVAQGTVLTVLDRTGAGDWLKVQTPRANEGWVAARYVTPISSGSGTASVRSGASAGSAGQAANVPAYAGQPFGPNAVTRREGILHECFGSGSTPLRPVLARTPVQVIGVGDFAPPDDERVKLGPGPYAKIRIWDGQYAWIAVSLLDVDPNAVPRTSSTCEDWDRIDWSRVVRPTPSPPGYPTSPGGGQTGCCKICRKGKACGDTCIASYKTCHVGPGCACNG